MSKTKIMHFIHGLNTGGAETLVKNYMLNFNQSKYDVVLLCLNHEKDSPYEGDLRKNGIRMIFVQDGLPFKGSENFCKKVVDYLYSFVVVKRIIRSENPDILHTHLPINSFVKYAKPSHDTVIFHTVHNEPARLWPKNNRKRQKDFRAVKWLVKHYGMRFIVLHKEMKMTVNKMFGVDNTIVLNNGVDVERIRNPKSATAMRRELGIPKDAFVMGHVGRFSNEKNQSFLVDILENIIKEKENSFLLMVGDGPNKSTLIAKLQEKGLENRYLILSNRNDISDLLNLMDIFVFPSLYEGLPLSLIEAQIAKKPCFISDSINSQAIISNLVTGLSLGKGVGKWAKVILNYKRPTEIIVNDADWNIANITKQLEQIYRASLEEKAGGE